jgi:hypothetical protein
MRASAMTDASSRRSPIDSDGMAVAGQEPSDRSFNAKSRFDRAGTAAISALIASASVAAVTHSAPSWQVAARSSRMRAAARSAASCSMLVTTAPPGGSEGQHRTASPVHFSDYEGYARGRPLASPRRVRRPQRRHCKLSSSLCALTGEGSSPDGYGIGVGPRMDDRF